ncbi:MAG: DUF3843 family protein [Pseudomonadota bacterium]
MKNILSMNFRLNRPKIYPGKGDKHLTKIIKDLANLLRKTQKEFKHETLRLPGGNIRELAEVLVEFAEDVHNDIGIWKSLEKYNDEFFGTNLPLTLQPDEDMVPDSMNQYRIQHLLWVQYQFIHPQLILSPKHQDLFFLAETISDFLEDRFKTIPTDSSVKIFLDQPNDYGWDIKRKLVWLGKHSYLFRKCYQDYVESNGGKPETSLIDDFICQETTCWSGLGLIDILASLLDITEKQKDDIRSWYERHAAFYKVLSVKGPLVEMLNIINDKPYTIRVGEFSTQFEYQHIYFGSLVPWNGEWYWSGVQQRFSNVSEKEIRELKDIFLRKSQAIAYRYCDELLNKARKVLRDQHKHFIEYHGKDLVVYPDGNSMTVDFNKQNRLYNESKLKSAGSSSIKNKNHDLSDLTKSFPPELLDSDNGIGIYFNPNEGQEVMREFYDIINGFKKKGVNLDEDEMDAIRGFISSTVISPHFVKKLVEEYGGESISAAFLIPDNYKGYYLDYLLRKYKGDFYRNRYPSISFVQT